MVFDRRPQMVLSLPDGLRVSKSYAELSFFPAAVETTTSPYVMTVDGPGVYILPGGYRLTVEECPPPSTWEELSPARACFDAGAAPFPWLVRTFRAGDRLVPLGMTGHKKVKDLFIDEKVPLRERRRIPLVFSGERLIWAGTLRTSAEVRITGATRKAVHAEILDMYSLMDL
jgi:tRNA(Ile)-lysidine synthase